VLLMRVFLVLLILLVVSACGPTQKAYQALKKLKDDEFVKAEKIVAKALEKDSLLPANLFAKSKLLIGYNSPEFYDSAYWYANKAIAQFDSLENKIREQHIKNGFGKDSLVKQKEVIDSLAFRWAERKNTEKSYNYFLEKYSTARQTQLAKTKRNALAFATARRENTYQGYKEFIKKYPTAVQVQEARERYEKLYFDKSTADGKVTSFIRFLEENPNTPYRREAEQNIFEVVTSEHSVGGYQIFLKNYPKSHLRQKAINYAYHVAKSDENQRLSIKLSDSLLQAKRLEPFELLPIIEGERFGFMEVEGKIIIESQLDSIDYRYKCQVTNDDFLIADQKVYGRNSTIISDKNYSSVTDLGFGLMKVGEDDYYGVVHKSGMQIEDVVYSDIKLFNGNILALKKGEDWLLKTISGRLLIADEFDDIFQLGTNIALELNDRLDIKTPRQLLSAVDGNPIAIDYDVIDFELLKDGNIWVETDEGEIILNENLESLTPKDVVEIDILQNGYILKYEDEQVLLDGDFNEILSSKSDLSYSKYWLVFDKEKESLAVGLNESKRNIIKADSFQLHGDFFLSSFSSDSVIIHSPNRSLLINPSNELEISLLKGQHAQYLSIDENNDITLIDSAGNRINPAISDGLTPIGNEFLIVNYRNKKGLLSALTGQAILKPEYDAIGNYENGSVSLLKDAKFGLYNSNFDLTIRPVYEKNITNYNDSIFIVTKDDKSYFYSSQGEEFPDRKSVV